MGTTPDRALDVDVLVDILGSFHSPGYSGPVEVVPYTGVSSDEYHEHRRRVAEAIAAEYNQYLAPVAPDPVPALDVETLAAAMDIVWPGWTEEAAGTEDAHREIREYATDVAAEYARLAAARLYRERTRPGGDVMDREPLRVLADDHRQRTLHVYDDPENRGTHCRICEALTEWAASSVPTLDEEDWSNIDEALGGYPRESVNRERWLATREKVRVGLGHNPGLDAVLDLFEVPAAARLIESAPEPEETE